MFDICVIHYGAKFVELPKLWPRYSKIDPVLIISPFVEYVGWTFSSTAHQNVELRGVLDY